MTSSTSFNPIAAEEVTEAAAFYGLESNALRSRFLAAVEAAVEEIE